MLVPSASTALWAQLTAACLFSVIAVVPFVRMIISAPSHTESSLMETVRHFGVPYSILLVCQWLQFSVDRFVIDQVMDKSSVGLYVSAYQVCGVPFMLLSNNATWLFIPIAYQRARDIENPAQPWAADKIFLGAIAVYCGIGLLAVGALASVGPRLIVLLTSPEYVIPSSTVTAIAVGRYVQCLAFLIQPIFAIHQKMTSSLAFRLIGAALAVPISWFGVTRAGIAGAAFASIVAGTIYLLLLIAGPNGCLWLVLRSRAETLGPRDSRDSEHIGTRGQD